MHDPLDNLHGWDTANTAIAADRVAALAERLPSPWKFKGVRTQTLASQSHRIAFFAWHDTLFALIPGSTATLGYDRAQALKPSHYREHAPTHLIDAPYYEAYLQELHEEEAYFNQFPDLDAYLAERNTARPYSRHLLTPVRTVQIKPFLVEVQSRDTFSNQATPHHVIRATIEREGFRLVTSDEWEYMCAAGSRSLFRWGNDCPHDRYPVAKHDEAEALEPWDMHEQPNAFGLLFSPNPYHWEVCAESEILRGGDGGGAMCGGDSFFAAWLSLASAYAVAWKHELIFGGWVRRAYSIPQT